jgi:putative redox protein
MKTLVKWVGKNSENPFQFLGASEDGHESLLSAKSGQVAKVSASPKEVVAMGQAACTAIDVVSSLQKMREPIEDLAISCDVAMTSQYPQVFSRCEMVYEFSGVGLNPSKAAHAVELSLLKYCGVSAMIERSGCEIVARLKVNGQEVSIWDPVGEKSSALKAWIEEVGKKAPRGIALVVGASRGIGRALVSRLSRMGYAVVPASRGPNDEAGCDRESDRVNLDVTNEHSRIAFASLMREAGLRPSLVIYNAGRLDKEARSASELGYSELREVFETNLFGIVDLNRRIHHEVAPDGLILFISSYMGLPNRNEFNYSSYRLSKCALTLYAREFGKEMRSIGSNIAVAALHPGSVNTTLNPGGTLTPDQSADRILLLLDDSMRPVILERNGEFWMVSNSETSITPWNV